MAMQRMIRPGYYAQRVATFRANMVAVFGRSFLQSVFGGCVGGLLASILVLSGLAFASSMGWKLENPGAPAATNSTKDPEKSPTIPPDTGEKPATTVRFNRAVDVLNSETKKKTRFKVTFERAQQDKVANIANGFKVTGEGFELDLIATLSIGNKQPVQTDAVADLDSSQAASVQRDAKPNGEGLSNYFSKGDCAEGACIFPGLVFGTDVYGTARCKASAAEAIAKCDAIVSSWLLEKLN
jgi:hypothetical protein